MKGKYIGRIRKIGSLRDPYLYAYDGERDRTMNKPDLCMFLDRIFDILKDITIVRRGNAKGLL